MRTVGGEAPDGGLSPSVDAKTVGVHHLLLAAVLTALLLVAGTNAVWTADEGALLHQISSLADGEGWSSSHPFPEADPAGTRYPLHLSLWATDEPTATGDGQPCPEAGVGCRYLSLAKHSGFVWLAAGLYGVGGYPALLVVSALGTLAAAIAASRLAARIDRRAELPTLWIAGLASPLLINGYVAWAHAPTAALVGWAVHWLIEATDGNGRRWPWPAALLALAGAGLLRTEAPLAGIAIGVAWIGLWSAARIGMTGRPAATGRAGRQFEPANDRRLVLGLGVLAATASGIAVDRLTDRATLGPVEPPSFDEAFGLIGGRLEGLANTWLRPGYVIAPADLLLLVSAALVVAAAVFFRRGEDGRTIIVPALTLALLCVVVRFLLMPVALVPGLLVACPLLAAGLIVIDRQLIARPAVQMTLVPFVLFCGAVLLTQYRGGGGGEWGGRYFALGLPLGFGVAVPALLRAGRRLSSSDRRQAGALLLSGALLLNLMGLLGLRTIRDRTAELSEVVAGVTAATGPAGDGDRRPVVVTTMNGLGRWLWEDLDDLRMLRTPSEDLSEVARTLERLGVQRVTLVTLSPERDTPLFEPWFSVRDGEVDDAGDPGPVTVAAGTIVPLVRR